MESKYLARFNKAGFAGHFNGLRGDRMIVEVLPKEELKTAGGLVMATSLKDHRSSTEENRATLAIVLAVGAGYFDDETGEDVELEFYHGNVILLSQGGLKLYTSFPGITEYTANEIALTRESEVHLSWPSIDAYKAYSATINS